MAPGLRVTPYSAANQAFSNRAHLAAQRLIYPMLFGVAAQHIAFECTSLHLGERERILDGAMAVDRIAHVAVPGLRNPLSHTIQERFRQPEFEKYRDLTVTEWNTITDQPSELYKITAGLFVYGYYNPLVDNFIDAIVINTSALLLRLSAGTIAYETCLSPRSQQTFIALPFNTLEQAGVVELRYNGPRRPRDEHE